MKAPTIQLDPRWFQIIFQAIFLAYGLVALHWTPEILHYALSIGGCLAATYIAECLRQGRFLHLTNNPALRSSAFSVLISAVSLCLLLKTNHWTISLLAAVLTVASKYIFRIGKKHLFNPSAFGIAACILLTGRAWISPSQWGNHAVMFFAIITLGAIVVTRVQKLDVSLAFLLTFAGLLFWRQVLVLGWPMDYFIHSVTTGGLLLFSFFMISDPRTSPNHPAARMLWAVLIAIVAFYLSAFRFMNSTPVWVLVFAAPLVPLLDAVFKAAAYQWRTAPLALPNGPHPVWGRAGAVLILVGLVAYEAASFCGFYVSKADGTLKNKTSQVIMVRDGDRTVITMYNDFKGDFKEFAMVVPVPAVLKKSDIKVVDQRIFNTLNDYSTARLVEYHDANPCQRQYLEKAPTRNSMDVAALSSMAYNVAPRAPKVKIEARYVVGEYDILILSATESTALKTWLTSNGYKIPPNANEVLDPYIRSNLKFFVVKVNEEEKRKLPGNFLRPIQIAFNSPKFMLPIRLGMANADGDQDLIVYAFSKHGRTELTNYRTVRMPTGQDIPLFVRDNFSAFYTNLFKHQWLREDKSVGFLEYAWDVSPSNYVKCDPCVGTAPSQQDLVQAGVWWMQEHAQGGEINGDNNNGDNGSAFFTRLHLRYNRQSFPQDLQFQLTPNTESFQARYVLHHPAGGPLDCDEARAYKDQLRKRRLEEFANLRALTGKGPEDWDLVGLR